MLKNAKQLIICSLVLVLLSACGGSSDSGGASPGPTVSNLKITFNPVAGTIPANTNDYPIIPTSPFFTQLNVNVTFDNGTAIPDGTNIQLSTSNVQVAPISKLDDAETTEINEFTTLFGSVGDESSGGNGTFFIHGSSPGTVTLTASAVDPQTGRTSSATFNYTISPGPDPFDRLTLEAQSQTIPANIFNLSPEQAFLTVYMTEVEISFRDALGNFVNPVAGEDGISTVAVSINPLSVAAFSTLDDGETDDVNEIFVLLGSGPVNMTAGKGKIFVWASDPGVATITVNALDQFTGLEISQQLEITVDAGTDPGLPNSISLTGTGNSYINGSGGSQSQTIQAFVESSTNVSVNDPIGFNNVMVDLSTDSQNSGEKLSGINAQGQNVQGQSINISSNNGVASFQLLSGSSPNTAIITVTTDRADNSVDNGLQDPITAQGSFVISDGVLFGLDITSPEISGLFINRVDGGVVNEDGIGNLDGSYSLTISAIGTDKGGNPALPQTIQFGLIDSPVIGFPSDGPGTFVNSGTDGDPQESGNLFTSLSGDFINGTAEVQPSDTLLVFGEEILRNEDLESAVTVQSILSDSTVRIAESFNANNLSGTVINDLDIFPYIIGRAVDGNINATGIINENGVVSTEINYPVSKLGKIAGIYAKGQGATTNGVTRSVTDVEMIVYPGAGSVGNTDLTPSISVSPSIIPANTSTPIRVCVYDAAFSPLQGASVQWAYVGGAGTGSIDNDTGSGILDNKTDESGCATGIATASGVTESSDSTGFIFNVGSISCLNDSDDVCIRIADPGAIYLSATPAFHFTSGLKIIDLFLFGGNGQGIPNVPLFASCESTGGVLSVNSQPGNTDENGMTIANVGASLNGFGEFFTGTCTFTTGSGTPEAVVEFTGVDLCDPGVSPIPPAQCTP
jgi:hypothetical protein